MLKIFDENKAKPMLWEILVPTVRPSGRPYHLRYHKLWDEKVKAIANGLTILSPARGYWVSPVGTTFTERMIPVRIACDEIEIEAIADITAKHYEQLAVMFYKVSDYVRIKHYE